MNWFAAAAVVFCIGTASASNYSYPRILILGPTGVGKSSLGNVLAGCLPSDEDCFFPVCNGIDSCTKETTIAESTFLGNFTGDSAAIIDGNVTLIDSPGFGDTDNEQPTLIAEMIDVLKNGLGEANTLLLCFEGGRWNEGILNMVQEMESLFGRDRLWKNVVVEITKWAFTETAIEDRERQGKTEDGTCAGINEKLQEMFHLKDNLTCVFIDSFAVYHSDEVEKEYFLNYTRTLWKLSNEMELFDFYTIEDILEQLHVCQEKNDCLNEVLEGRISNLETNVISNTRGIDLNINSITSNNLVIENNKNNIANNTIDINTNKNDIKTNNDANTGKIDANTGKINTNKDNININKNSIKTNTDKIKTNKDNIDINTHDIATNLETIETLTNLHISQCGYQSGMGSTGKITYDRLATDVNSLKPNGGLDIATGVFTAPIQGTYLVNINFYTLYAGLFYVYPYKNNGRLDHFYIHSSSIDNDWDSSGRSFSIELDTDDTLHVGNGYMTGNSIGRITFCTTLIK